MLLTKLEIKGFKSFGDKVTILFDEGVTGIVGQNGCGKSNVVDAIRWVLGEQKTRALRSDKMENIIFNGTKKRKPLNLAEVSLTFKNTKNILATEYSEVTITRRLYRTGESEYLLNNVPCRLKDINNLFLDTGIGPDSYAIIELKMVDDILNDKENSRRNLFEEAAGISKFKIRKKETLKKLEDADQDLARVEDLLFELQKQLKTLEREAKRTEKYFKTKEEYKKASLELAKKSVSDKRELMLHLANQLQKENDEKLHIQTQITEKEALIEKQKNDFAFQGEAVRTKQKEVNEFFNEIRQYENEKKIRQERIKMLYEKQKNLQEQIEHDKEREQEIQRQISNWLVERGSAEKLMKELWLELQSIKAEYEAEQQKVNALQGEFAELSTLLNSKQEQVFSLTKQYEIKQTQVKSLGQEIAKAKSEGTQRNEDLALFQEQLELSQNELQDLKSELERLQTNENDLQNRLQDLLDENAEIKEILIQKNRLLDAKRNEYKLTKSLVENLEGFPEAIKFLKKQDFFSQTPLLSDIFTCKDDYKPAIEAFLENLLSFYVVKTPQEAYEAISLLTKSEKGKANFFILESITQENKPTPKPQNCISALEILEFEPIYQNLFTHLFENVFLAEKEAIPDLQKKHPNCIFISKDAQIVSRKARISGGSVGSFEGKNIGRKKQLETLQKEIEVLESEIADLQEQSQAKQAEINDLKNASFKEQIRETQIAFHKKNEQFITLRTKTEQLQSLIESGSENLESLQERLEEYQSELKALEPQIKQAEAELYAIREEHTTKNQLLQKANDLLSQKLGVFNQQNLKYHQQESRVQSIEQEIKFNESALDALRNRLQKNNEELSRVSLEIEGFEETKESEDDKILLMYEQKAVLEKELNEIEKEYYALQGEIGRLEKEVRELQRKREQTDLIIGEINAKINETKLSFASIKERLSVEFNVDLEALMSDENAEISEKNEAELKEEVQRLKNVLDTIGAINPMAMEAFKEIKERNDFILAQKEDLLKAKNSLLETIQEIDTVARENFLTTFEAIRQNFQKVFRSLFTEEDTCDLVLVNPENPLESPIDIIAKPKGKRPLTINQLSGGEKTLTATSLLFAIYLIKPAPFCIFDEVDAPLDDANVDKFTNIIRKFSEESQFIIVTHNKRTMAATDIMYGITMFPEDPGVSKLVPVDMRVLQN
ncbi:chromosome segregation protein SMC [Raineya orbicola]|jgi:chromosome segregation protein|uniref:Chromosome partition protein Smc n=1 Tax=Raineya orbicola TaxID=2016530 RepID=A0A2N3IJR6_9BACT|nr:chromosome segregation protein SMC [Raineya orbicola]PKQ70508.1 Chromosome segregation protein SMC [Raineya orbicola]